MKSQIERRKIDEWLVMSIWARSHGPMDTFPISEIVIAALVSFFFLTL